MADIPGLLDKYSKIEGERFFTDIFKEEEYQAVKDDSHTDDVVIDIGALAGEFCAYIYPQASIIYAIEPVPSYYNELTDNINEFDLSKIRAFNFAIGGANETRRMTANSRGGRGGDSFTADTVDESIEVDAVTLATFMRTGGVKHVDILKIDVENAEQEIFNAPDFAEVAPMIKVITGEHLDGVAELLTKLGYTKDPQEGVNAVYRR